MSSTFIQQEWEILCQRLSECAIHLGQESARSDAFAAEASQFADQPPPERYPDLLRRYREAANLASVWRTTRDESPATPQRSPSNVEASPDQEPPPSEAMVDETIDESFPASDPPAWTHSHA